MPPAHSPALVIEHLIKDVGPVDAAGGRMKRVVEDVNLEAHFGQVTVLLGPNGAGKTTSMECAQGLKRCTAGTIRLLGRDPEKADASLRARVGVMLQDGGLPPAVKPLPLLRHIARMYREPRPYRELVQALGIDAYADTPVRRLSGGQRQRLALAAAVIGRPQVIFLDEPTAGLDPVSRRTVLELIERLRAEGAAVVLTTHLLADAEALADVISVIVDGRTVATGTLEQLRARQGNGYRLSFQAPPGVDFSAILPSALTVHEEPAGHYLAEGTVAPADLLAMAAWFHERGLMPGALTLAGYSLEETFMKIVTERPDTAARPEEAPQ